MHEDTLPRSVQGAAAPADPAASAIQEEVVAMFSDLRAPILRYLRVLGLPPGDGEDITQDAFVELFRHLNAGKSRQNLRGWLFRVAHNLALKRKRDERGHCELQEEWTYLVDALPNPEEQASLAQHHRAVRGVVGVIPPEDRQCLLLRAEGLSYREIAEVLGMSLGWVALSLSRSMSRIARATRSEK